MAKRAPGDGRGCDIGRRPAAQERGSPAKAGVVYRWPGAAPMPGRDMSGAPRAVGMRSQGAIVTGIHLEYRAKPHTT
jgi:hypothetical protein